MVYSRQIPCELYSFITILNLGQEPLDHYVVGEILYLSGRHTLQPSYVTGRLELYDRW